MPALPNNIALQGPRLLCKPFGPEAITDEYLAWLNDAEVNRYSRRRHVTQGRADAERFIAALGDNEVVLKLMLLQGQRHVGNLQIGPIDWINRCGEIRILLGDRSVWGQGIGTEAVYLATKFMFGELGLHRVEANSCNPAFIRCVEKLGWRREGVLRQRLLSDHGEWMDYAWYGLLSSEFVEYLEYVVEKKA